MKDKLVIWGASGHALVVADIIRLQGKYELIGFIDDLNPQSAGTTLCGATVLGGREHLESLLRDGVNRVIFGFGNCQARLQLSQLIREKGFQLATAIHPRSTVAEEVGIGAGTVVVAGAIINPGCHIGENVIFNTGATVDHGCLIGDGVHLCPGVHLAGNVEVGRGSWVGIGAVVTGGVKIGAGTIVGAGAVVVNDLPDNVVAYGVPARVMRKNETNN